MVTAIEKNKYGSLFCSFKPVFTILYIQSASLSTSVSQPAERMRLCLLLLLLALLSLLALQVGAEPRRGRRGGGRRRWSSSRSGIQFFFIIIFVLSEGSDLLPPRHQDFLDPG